MVKQNCIATEQNLNFNFLRADQKYLEIFSQIIRNWDSAFFQKGRQALNAQLYLGSLRIFQIEASTLIAQKFVCISLGIWCEFYEQSAFQASHLVTHESPPFWKKKFTFVIESGWLGLLKCATLRYLFQLGLERRQDYRLRSGYWRSILGSTAIFKRWFTLTTPI